MKASSTAAVFAAAMIGNVAAYPQLAEKLSLDKRQDANFWQAAGAGDARTACPGCNTLANHGYINRNGRGITAQQLQQGFFDAFGFDFAITEAGARNAVNLQNNGQGTFDLDTMDQPHIIEHDGSLTRNDLQMIWNQDADNHDFNATVWCQTQELYGNGDHVDAVAANTARLGRNTQAQMEDFPGWFDLNEGGALAEAGFYLTSMDDPTVDGLSARLDWLNYWFTNERLPTELGWVRPAISNDQFNAAVAAVSAAAPTMTPTGLGSCGAPASSATPSSSASSVSGSSASSVSSSSASSTSSTGPYIPTYTSLPSSPPYANSTYTITPVGTPTLGPVSGPNTTPLPSATVAPGCPVFPDVPSSVLSAAKDQATALAGPAPQVPNAYSVPLKKDQWDTVETIVTNYVTKVESIILSLCGLHSTGSMAMPGVPGSGSSSGGAPWYSSMSAGASSPQATSASGSYAPLPGAPAATCACT